MRKIKILAFVCLSFFFSEVVAQTATQQKYQLPLLKGKKINPVLRLAIEISNSGSELNGVTVNIPQNVEDVESIQLLALNQDSAFVTDAKLEKATVFSSAMPKTVILITSPCLDELVSPPIISTLYFSQAR